MTSSSITIVTAFFDIGRGKWSNTTNVENRFRRTADDYFNYFKNLAKVKNHLVVYTSAEFESKILEIRDGLSTEVHCLDIKKEFSQQLAKINKIHTSDFFKSMVHPSRLNNPESWCSEYVLVTNLKFYFMKDCASRLPHNSTIAWIDFGYFREENYLNNVELWDYKFDSNYFNVFTVKRKCPVNKYDNWQSLINSKDYLAGGCMLSSGCNWLEMYELTTTTINEMNIFGYVDDDQGIVLRLLLDYPEKFKVNFLGKNDWFALFKKYGHKKAWWQKILN